MPFPHLPPPHNPVHGVMNSENRRRFSVCHIRRYADLSFPVMGSGSEPRGGGPRRRRQRMADLCSPVGTGTRRFGLHPGPLAHYGVCRVRSCRGIGGSRNVNDVSSRHCQRRKKIRLERLDEFDGLARQLARGCCRRWRATPADIVAARIDFQEWLRSLPAEIAVSPWS